MNSKILAICLLIGIQTLWAEAVQDSAVQKRLELSLWQQQLEKREKQIQDREERLKQVGKKVRQEFQEIQAKEKRIEKIFEGAESQHKEGLQKARELIASMNPEEAAGILEGLPEELSVNLLKELPSKRSAAVLAKMPPAKSAKILNGLTLRPTLTYAELLESLGFCPKCENKEDPKESKSN